MANPNHLKILEQGVEAWNKWREENPKVRPELSGQSLEGLFLREVNFSEMKISKMNFYKTDLGKAIFENSELRECNFIGANLNGSNFRCSILSESNFGLAGMSGAYLGGAFIYKTIFTGVDFSRTYLSGAALLEVDLSRTILSWTNFNRATIVLSDLSESVIVNASFKGAEIRNTRIYGISAWNIKKEGLIQKDLIITPPREAEITLDDFEVAQFIYLLLDNQNLRNVIDTITSKAVLILGRFTEEKKKVLDALKDELRKRNYLPIVFDFKPSESRNLTETVSILANMSRFVIADLTDPHSIPQELATIIPSTRSQLVIVPIILDGEQEYAMFESFVDHRSVLPIYRYGSSEILLKNIISAIITPAEQKVEELRQKPV